MRTAGTPKRFSKCVHRSSVETASPGSAMPMPSSLTRPFAIRERVGVKVLFGIIVGGQESVDSKNVDAQSKQA